MLLNRYQDVLALFISSCCDQEQIVIILLLAKLMTVTDLQLLQVISDDFRLVGTTCFESVDLTSTLLQYI